MIKRRILFYIIFSVLILACNRERGKIHIFVPENYIGFVNIRYGDKDSKNKMIITDNKEEYFIFVTSPQKIFSLRDTLPYNLGYYDKYIYYYNNTSICLIDSTVSTQSDPCLMKFGKENYPVSHFTNPYGDRFINFEIDTIRYRKLLSGYLR